MNSKLSATSRNQIRNRMVKLAGASIRNYAQPTELESANDGVYPLALKTPGDQVLESSDNDLTNLGNHPTGSKNPAIIHRRFGNPSIRLPELSPTNRKLIVNQLPVIANPVALKLSPVHHQNAISRLPPRSDFDRTLPIEPAEDKADLSIYLTKMERVIPRKS